MSSSRIWHPIALRRARNGVYLKSHLEGLPDERQNRFLVDVDGAGWEGSTIEEVARREIEPYAESLSGQLVYRGDDILLPAKQMLSLSLAIHELATNAVKYGALSTSSGRIVIDADNSDGRIELSWHEEGGPEVVPPEDGDTVFGSLLLSRILGPDLHSQADLRYDAGGIVYSLAFPAATQKQHNPEPLT